MHDLIARWPGKSALENGIEHPAIYHMLDVAAVAEVLLDWTSLPLPRKQAFILLTGLHDLGKLNAGFRSMLRGEGSQRFRHWELTEIYLEAHLDFLAKVLKPERPRRLRPLISATAGHHGRPSTLNQIDKQRAAKTLCPDITETIEAFSSLWLNASLEAINEAQSYELSWWLSGLVTAADWIGSNADWFPPEEPTHGLSDYLVIARERAGKAVVASGILPAQPTATQLFNWPTFRPMQMACQSIPLPEGPMLTIIEDETGAGKTEAALMLAQRMLLADKGQGLFFALPTMATADAMFSRVSESIGKMFDHRPSVTLAHGRAGLSQDYRDIQQGNPNAPEDIGCTEWLGDSRRRSLLANVGVGTIDQALLSVLPVKFQTLRHFGLSSKILIVDEVHELGEAYIAEILTALLKFHRAAGGSAILLTATLPLSLRAKLLASYEGVDDGNTAYPALTIAGGKAVHNLPQETGAKGPVKVERLATSDAAIALIKEKVGQGAACVWVRNAVDDAISAVEKFRAEGIEADLLHARYALGDRKRIERTIRNRFGKTGTDRAGRVLVGTQVLESSLDLDFDVMVSDLAPMAGLVQRAGRLWRHMDIRPAAKRPVREPILYVVSPDPRQVDHDRWLMDVLDRGAYTYSADLMWRTACHLFDEGRIVAPSGIRSLIERAYSADPETPEVLDAFERNRIGKEMSHGSLATQNIVDITAGYREGGQAHDDARYPTRLGIEQRILVLAREVDGVLEPLFYGPDGWMMSEVSAAKHKIDKLAIPDQGSSKIVKITKTWKEWMRGSYLLCPVGEDGGICEGLSYFSDKGLVFSTDKD